MYFRNIFFWYGTRYYFCLQTWLNLEWFDLGQLKIHYIKAEGVQGYSAVYSSNQDCFLETIEICNGLS